MLRTTFQCCRNDTSAENRVRSQGPAPRVRLQLGFAEPGFDLSEARRVALPIRCWVVVRAFECRRVLVDTVRVDGADDGEGLHALGNAIRRIFRTIELHDCGTTTRTKGAAVGAAARAAARRATSTSSARAAARRATSASSGRAAARRATSAAVAFLSSGAGTSVRRGRVTSPIAAGQTQTERGEKDRNITVSHGTHELDPAIGDSGSRKRISADEERR